MDFIFDTGGSTLWFPTSNCTGCQGWRRYNTASSSAYVQLSENATYLGDYNSGVWGYPCTDQVWVTISNALQQMPCLAVYRQQNLAIPSASGVLGLSGSTNFIERLASQGIISKRIMSLQLNPLSESYITFGDPPPDISDDVENIEVNLYSRH